MEAAFLLVDRRGKLMRRIALTDYFPDFQLEDGIIIESILTRGFKIYLIAAGWNKLGVLQLKELEEYAN